MLLTLPAQYAEHCLCNDWVFVCLSPVCTTCATYRLSVYICCQRPCSAANQPRATAADDRQDRQTDTRLLDRQCAAYYVGSINNAQFSILYNTHSCCLNFRASARSCLCSAERTARWCNNSAEIMKPLESNCAFSLSALSISCEYQHHTTLSISHTTRKLYCIMMGQQNNCISTRKLVSKLIHLYSAISHITWI